MVLLVCVRKTSIHLQSMSAMPIKYFDLFLVLIKYPRRFICCIWATICLLLGEYSLQFSFISIVFIACYFLSILFCLFLEVLLREHYGLNNNFQVCIGTALSSSLSSSMKKHLSMPNLILAQFKGESCNKFSLPSLFYAFQQHFIFFLQSLRFRTVSVLLKHKRHSF